MATIKYLDNLPIDDELLRIPATSTDAARCKCYLNLAFNSFNAVSRLRQLAYYIKVDLKSPSLSDFTNFQSLNLMLEGLMTSLLSMSTISNVNRTHLTEHYCRRNITITSSKILPSETYVEKLALTGAKTWATYYGSLGYFINLREEYSEYLTPSQLVDINVNQVIELVLTSQSLKSLYTSTNKTADQITRIFRGLQQTILSDSIQADVNIYHTLVTVITDVELMNQAFRQLRFYLVWLPVVVVWYMKTFVHTVEVYKAPQDEHLLRAHTILQQVAQICLSNGLDESSFDNLDYQLIHQTIPPIYFSICEELNSLRKSIDYEYINSNKDKPYEEQLVDLFFNNIAVLSLNDSVRQASTIVLDSFTPPGGYNLLAVMISATLINRAYILTHSTNISESSKPFNEDTDLELLGRVARLIYLAGACLKKTSLEHLQNMGKNLDYLSGVQISNFRSKDLIDGR